jgi:hypothetical protein
MTREGMARKYKRRAREACLCEINADFAPLHTGPRPTTADDNRNAHRCGAIPRNAPHEICDDAPRRHGSEFARAMKLDVDSVPSTDG